jgi:hypothetical protein
MGESYSEMTPAERIHDRIAKTAGLKNPFRQETPA